MNPLVEDIEGAADSVLGRFQRPGMPGMSVGIVQGDTVLLRKGYGLADIGNHRPNAPEVPMRIASLSKQFTVTLAMMLEAEGQLSIDDPVRRYIPALPDYGVPVTLRDLMSNQSGVRDFLELRLLSGGNFSDPASDEESQALICSTAELNFEPGTRFAYSNTGFKLLTQVVEALEQDRLEDILRRRILKPLGMAQTSLARSDTPWLAERAVPYVVTDGIPVQGRWSIPLEGAGGMISTVDDLLKWARYVADPASPHAGLFAKMTQARPYRDNTPSLYGLGFTVMPYRGLNSFGHHGQLPGVFAEIAWFPDIDTTLVLLANTTEINPFLLGRQLADALFPDALAPRLPAPDPLPGYYYSREESRVLGVNASAELESAMTRTPLERHRPDGFRPYWPMLHLQLAPAGDALAGTDGPQPVEFVRLPAFHPADLHPYTGTFYQPALKSVWRISLENQQLLLTLSGPLGSSRFHLTPLTEEVLIAAPAINPDGDYRPTVRLFMENGRRRLLLTTDRTSRLFADEMPVTSHR
ncbi:serine hydrolase domain-containing protein [Sodalis sp. RH15]|uniref:serine hydrolase domain-containing protein n=1 Tax=Sodalis sp. RH15 TaxID=3394330 RepID=UPI0039B3CC56